jgi:CDP-paratose 2-epimerase
MNNGMHSRSVLIFGGAGFIGSNWAHRLLKHSNARVHVYDNLSRRGVEQNLHWLEKEARGNDRFKVTIGDTRNAAQVARAVESATEIYHFAAQVAVTTSVSDPRLDFDVNLGGTLNILEAVRKSGRRPFVLFTSTNKVYGAMPGKLLVPSERRYVCPDSRGTDETQPLDFHSPYGCSKGAADQYVHDYCRIYAIPTVVFRMSCIAGPRQFGNEDQGWIAHFLYRALQDLPITIYGDGRQVRDVLCVHDLIRAFEAVSANVARTAGQIYNVGGGLENSISLLEIVDEIEQVTGKRLRFTIQQARPGDQLLYVTDYSKLSRHLGWKPRMNVGKTLQAIHQWWQENHARLVSDGSVGRMPFPLLQEGIPGAVQ